MNQETRFPIYDAHYGVYPNRVPGKPTRLLVQNTDIFFPNGERYAFYHKHLGFITVAQKQEGIWQPQMLVEWDFGLISEELGFGQVLNVSDLHSHRLFRQNMTWITPSHPDYTSHMNSLVKTGRFVSTYEAANVFTFQYPDKTLGYWLENAITILRDGRPYQYVNSMVFPEEEFLHIFGKNEYLQYSGEKRLFFEPASPSNEE